MCTPPLYIIISGRSAVVAYSKEFGWPVNGDTYLNGPPWIIIVVCARGILIIIIMGKYTYILYVRNAEQYSGGFVSLLYHVYVFIFRPHRKCPNIIYTDTYLAKKKLITD